MKADEIRELKEYPGAQPSQLQWIALELAAQIAELVSEVRSLREHVYKVDEKFFKQ